MKNQTVLLLLISFIIFTSCDDNSTGTKPGQSSNYLAYVINEGNFNPANGSITGYSSKTKEANNKAFKDANNRKFVGFIQTSTLIGDRLYVVTNKPDKIEVMNLQNLKNLGTIELSEDPVAIASAGNDRAYVTNLNHNSVTILDLKKMEATSDTIAVGANPYFAFHKDGKVFVSNNGFGTSKTLSVINTTSDKVIDTLNVGYGPKQIAEDDSGRLWVICEGYSPYQQPEKDVPGGIYIVDPGQPAVVDSIKNGQNPKRITFDKQDGKAFVAYSGGNISEIDINNLQITDKDFISRTFNTVGYSPEEHLIYAGQSNGLEQNGKVIQYSLQGAAADSFETGISPIEFHFVAN